SDGRGPLFWGSGRTRPLRARAIEFSRNSKRGDETRSRFRHGVRPGSDRPSMRARHDLHPLHASLCALALALAAGGADARELTAQEAVAKVQHETNGKVLSVQTLMQGKRKVYRIKVLTLDGQVRVVQVSAEQ